MQYIFIILSILFTAPFSANAACGIQSFSNADGDVARWHPTEPNGCEYETNNGLDCPGSRRDLMYFTRGYHPITDLNPVYTGEKLDELNYTFNDICEPNIIEEEIPDPDGGDPLGICYKVYHYEADRLTGKWSECLPVSATKSGYHYEQTDTFNFNTHISYIYGETGSLDYGEIVANTADCADKIEEYVAASFPNIKCDGEIKGQMVWVPEYDGGYWSAANCTCNYTTILDWSNTSKADIACKLDFYSDTSEVQLYTSWYKPTDQDWSDEERCYITKTHACKIGCCIPPDADGTQCTRTPAGYYHDNDTDTQCQPCPAGTTSRENEYTPSIEYCFLPLGTVFTDSNGKFFLGDLGATEDIFYAQ